jgi:uncharacterized protein (TIGR03118 family)
MTTAMILGAAALPAGAVGTGAVSSQTTTTTPTFVQTNLVSNISTQGAQLVDVNLQNPWGLALSPTLPLWASDNNSGTATIYNIPPGGTSVTKAGLTVNVPGGRTSTSDGPSPTGQVFNPTGRFVVTTPAGSGPALFVFDSESGQISAWNPAADPITSGQSMGTLEYSSPTAVYKGLTLATGDDGAFLYAANFHDGTVDVFNSRFHHVSLPGGFTDPTLPGGYAPFGIQDIHNLIYVTYAKQNVAKHDDVSGPGHGFIDIYTPDGFLVERLASRGVLDSPWGMAIAPSSFGRFAGKLLVGNFGNGRVNVFDPFVPERFLGQLEGPDTKPITIDDLWALKVGTATTGGTQTMLFSAGINDENDGLIGSLNPSS